MGDFSWIEDEGNRRCVENMFKKWHISIEKFEDVLKRCNLCFPIYLKLLTQNSVTFLCESMCEENKFVTLSCCNTGEDIKIQVDYEKIKYTYDKSISAKDFSIIKEQFEEKDRMIRIEYDFPWGIEALVFYTERTDCWIRIHVDFTDFEGIADFQKFKEYLKNLKFLPEDVTKVYAKLARILGFSKELRDANDFSVCYIDNLELISSIGTYGNSRSQVCHGVELPRKKKYLIYSNGMWEYYSGNVIITGVIGEKKVKTIITGTGKGIDLYAMNTSVKREAEELFKLLR